MDLTIILVHYKSDHLKLKTCLESINSKSEVIIIDHSQDLVIKNLKLKNNLNINIVNNENKGNGGGINCGLKNSKTNYVLYLDIDTCLPSNFFTKIEEAVNKVKDFAVIAPKIKNFYNDNKINLYGNLSKSRFYYNKIFFNLKKPNKKFNNIKEVYFVSGSIMLLNKKIIEQKKIFFDENIFIYFEEDDFFHRCFKSNTKIYLIDDLEADHFDGSIKDGSINYECFKKWHWEYSKYYFFNKHYNKFLIFLIALKNISRLFIKVLFFYFINKKITLICMSRLNGISSYYLNKKCNINY
jgi:N-acetylglucosaminyl-diphospho-decaprenol L-rhamnosyltransferase